MKAFVAVAVVGLMVSPVLASNLVQNGTFDSNTTGWTYNDNGHNFGGMSSFGGGPDLPTPPSGNCLGFAIDSANYANSVWYTQVVNGLTVGQQYTFSGDYAGGYGISGNVNAVVRWGMLLEAGAGNNWGLTAYPGVGGVSPGYGAFNPATNTGWAGEVVNNYNNMQKGQWGWTNVTQTFTAVSTSETISLLAGSGSSSNVPWDYFACGFDNISLVATPEPASLILLALGLPMLRRRG